MKDKPCYKCEDRHFKCHSECDKYKQSLKPYDKTQYEYIEYIREQKFTRKR